MTVSNSGGESRQVFEGKDPAATTTRCVRVRCSELVRGGSDSSRREYSGNESLF